MKLTVFGASGAIGGHVMRQALEAGHEVAAVVRQATRLDLSHPALRVVTVPGLSDPEPLRLALEGRDAAISGVGPRRRRDAGVAAEATRGILGALKVTGVGRFVAVSAAPVGPVPEGESWLYRAILTPMISALLRDVYADLARMEEEIRRSGVEWTVLRPPKLVNKPLTGVYRLAVDGNVPRGPSIGRADVAHAMLGALTDPAMVGRAVGIAY
jgi:uncharacterized protein YbjT (DUF2867 family)